MSFQTKLFNRIHHNIKLKRYSYAAYWGSRYIAEFEFIPLPSRYDSIPADEDFNDWILAEANQRRVSVLANRAKQHYLKGIK